MTSEISTPKMPLSCMTFFYEREKYDYYRDSNGIYFRMDKKGYSRITNIALLELLEERYKREFINGQSR